MKRPASLRNFPAPRTPFVGRDLELAELGTALHDPHVRLLTLVEPGGIGKSRLAQQLASDQAGSFANGAAYVPLAPVAAIDQVLDAVIQALDLERSRTAPPTSQLADFLRDRETLLLIDNLEHLLEAGGDLLELLDRAPGLRLVATSREPLDLPGETLYELSGLSFPAGIDADDIEAYDAVALFIRSARRVHQHFTINRDNRGDVIALCRLLQGLPLGLELAAA